MLRKIIGFLFDSAYQVVTWVWIGVSISAFFYFASVKSAGGMAGSAISLLLAVIIMLAILAKKYFWDGTLANDRPNRPKMYVEVAQYRPLVAGHKKAVALWLRNGGGQTACNIKGWISQGVTRGDFAGPLKFTPLVEPGTRSDCEPGAAITFAGMSKEPVTQPEIDSLNKRKTLWFHFGKGAYEDESGRNTYEFDFCFMYEPTIHDRLIICPDKFWPKNQERGKAKQD